MSANSPAVDAAKYKRDGYLFPIGIMSAEEAAGKRARLEALEARGAELTKYAPRDLNQYFRVNSHYVTELGADLASDPRILDAVEAILGPDLIAWGCEFFIKEPKTDKIVTWHQDLTYWGLGSTDQQVTAWLALSPVTVASGCMRFVPGSHTSEIVPHKDTFADDNLLSRGQEIAVEVDENDAVNIELEPGRISLHHGRIFHASGPNVSDDRRIGVVVRFITPEVKQHVSSRDYGMLVRGFNHTGNFLNVARPARDLDPAALRLYEQILTDQSSALTEGAETDVGMYAAYSDDAKATTASAAS
ncbi:MAG: phytanoyl-CoA dioxygenase family protein [Hyphomicrobiaceae bacterium]